MKKAAVMAALALYIHALKIKRTYLFSSIRTMSFQPQAYSFGIAADSMMQAILLRYLAVLRKLPVKYAIEIFLEVAHKDLAVFAGQDTADVVHYFGIGTIGYIVRFRNLCLHPGGTFLLTGV